MKAIAPIFEALGNLKAASIRISEQNILPGTQERLIAYMGRVLDNVLSNGFDLLFDPPTKESVIESTQPEEFVTPKGRKIRYVLLWVKRDRATANILQIV